MSSYPVTFDVEYPEGQGARWMILVRWILAIPHWIVLYILQYIAYLFTFIAFFTVLFAKTYPNGMFRFMAGWLRWTQNVGAYAAFRNEYPPFSLREGAYAPVQLTIEKPVEYNRWLPLIKWLLAIPHFIVIVVLGFIAIFVGLYMLIAVLVTGAYPRGAFDFLVGVSRWGVRVNAYVYLLVDEYPPFSLK